jgi:glycogen debranching enzyme
VPANSYTYPPERLLTGANLGNWELFLKLTSHSDVGGLWSAVDNQIYCGRWVTTFSVERERATAVETTHAPAYQDTTYRCAGLIIRKLAFLPVRDDLLQIMHMPIAFENTTDKPLAASVVCDVHFPAFVWPGMYKIPEMAQRNKRVAHREIDGVIVSATVGNDKEVRVFGADAEPESTNLTDRGFQRTYRIEVPARAKAALEISMSFSHRGQDDAIKTYRQAPRAAEALAKTEAEYERVHRNGVVRTPEAAINRAFDWAKINTVRVEHRFPSGFGFTNDPSQDIVVTRDVAWFVSGSDYITPDFSRGMLDLVAAFGIEPGGKITEFINACANPPTRSDYDLNINDDTPLIIGAVYHHFAVTRDRSALDRAWPMTRNALEWIIAQMIDGLVFSDSRESNVWGISGWRNIIPQGQISGWVTEINAECAYALRLGAQLARLMGAEADAERYAETSDALKDAINTRLVSEKTGLYLLNIDPEGEKHHDLTGDQIFPVLFGVADEQRRRKVLDLLYTPEFWTQFGVRTVGKHQDEYDPDYGIQLLGGVWPNLTAWVGFGGRYYSPRRLASALRNIWRISEVDNPRAYYNVVPGLFPERLSGDSFKSRGMAMSPWMPPTYLWTVYEGLLGFEPTIEGLRINPHIPADWSWIGARDVPVMGGRLSMFYHRRRLHANMAVRSRSKIDVYDEDVSRFIECDAPFSVALRQGKRVAIFIGTAGAGSFTLKILPPLTSSEEIHRIALPEGGSKAISLRMAGRASVEELAAR